MRGRLSLIFGLSSIWLVSPCFFPGYAPFDVTSLRYLPVSAEIVALLSVVAVVLAVRSLGDLQSSQLRLFLLKLVLALSLAEITYWTISEIVTQDDPKQMIFRQILGMALSIPFVAAALVLGLRNSGAKLRWAPWECVAFIARVFGAAVVIDAAL